MALDWMLPGLDGMMEGLMGGSTQEMMGGAATDEMFLRMMIPHHQMAVGMAEKAIEEADHPERENLTARFATSRRRR